MNTPMAAFGPKPESAKLRPMQIYGRRLFFWDFVVVTFSFVVISNIFFANTDHVMAEAEASGALRIYLNPIALGLAMWLMWLLALTVAKSWDDKKAGTGIEEYLMLARTGLSVLLTLAFASLLFKTDVSRAFVITVVVVTTALLIGHRWVGRQWLLAQRKKGKFLQTAVLVGSPDLVLVLAVRLLNDKYAGYLPKYALIFDGKRTKASDKKLQDLGMQVITYESISPTSGNIFDADSVMVLGSDDIDAARIKRIAWSLESTRMELIVAPALVDFAGDRITTRNVAAVPFLHIETPRFTGIRYFAKRIMDYLLAFMAIVITTPIFVVTALAVFAHDRGPVLFLQERVGKNGATFQMLKFRSMSVGADKHHESMKASSNKSPNSKMYKNPEDPRVTPVGKFIRRWSIDELPQLFNVVAGHMSMVGPRPPLPSEVAEYERHAHRRLLVNPGITGLWQVSGRSLLSWDETVALDLDYVENWSPFGDLLLLLKTLKAVIGQRGAV